MVFLEFENTSFVICKTFENTVLRYSNSVKYKAFADIVSSLSSHNIFKVKVFFLSNFLVFSHIFSESKYVGEKSWKVQKIQRKWKIYGISSKGSKRCKTNKLCWSRPQQIKFHAKNVLFSPYHNCYFLPPLSFVFDWIFILHIKFL